MHEHRAQCEEPSFLSGTIATWSAAHRARRPGQRGEPRGRHALVVGACAAMQTQRAGAIACFLGAALFALFAIAVADRDAKLGPDAPIADATVVEVFRGRTSTVVVDFTTADGQQIRAETEDWYWDPEPAAGDGGRVRYDPREPGRLRP
jgi:hypothetical protein